MPRDAPATAEKQTVEALQDLQLGAELDSHVNNSPLLQYLTSNHYREFNFPRMIKQYADTQDNLDIWKLTKHVQRQITEALSISLRRPLHYGRLTGEKPEETDLITREVLNNILNFFTKDISSAIHDVIEQKSFNMNDIENRNISVRLGELVSFLKANLALSSYHSSKVADDLFNKFGEKPLLDETSQLEPTFLADAQIPKDARELWVNRRPEDKTPGHFIQRVYGAWIGKGFHSGHVRKLDGSLEKAYERWMKAGAPGSPEGFHLPTKHEAMLLEPALDTQARNARRHADRIRQRVFREKRSSER